MPLGIFGRDPSTRRQSAVATRGGTGHHTPRFYQTKPIVMLGKTYLCGTRRMGCVDYRKMTTGFVFSGIGFGDWETGGQFMCAVGRPAHNRRTARQRWLPQTTAASRRTRLDNLSMTGGRKPKRQPGRLPYNSETARRSQTAATGGKV